MPWIFILGWLKIWISKEFNGCLCWCFLSPSKETCYFQKKRNSLLHLLPLVRRTEIILQQLSSASGYCSFLIWVAFNDIFTNWNMSLVVLHCDPRTILESKWSLCASKDWAVLATNNEKNGYLWLPWNFMSVLSMLQVDTELSLMKQERIRLQKQVIFCDGILMSDLNLCRLSHFRLVLSVEWVLCAKASSLCNSWRLLIMQQKRHRRVCGGSMRVHEPAFTLMKNSVLSRLRYCPLYILLLTVVLYLRWWVMRRGINCTVVFTVCKIVCTYFVCRSGSWTSYARVMLSFERKIAEILKIAGWEKSFLCFCSGDVDAFKLVLIEFLQDIVVTGVRMGELSGFRNGEIRQERHRQNWSLSVSY